MNRLRSIHTLLAAGLLASAAAFATEVPAASLRCENFVGSSTPIGYCANGRYFCVGTALRPLVGVSADAGCHIPLTDANVCNRTNSQEVIDSIANQNLNKMRLWVSLAGNSPVTGPASAHPFVYVPAAGATPAYWRLDRVNEVYFDKLENVVYYANGKGITVEATFFAPGEGTFTGGPWDNGKGKVCVNSSGVFQPGDTTCTLPGNTLQNAGFSNQSYFVQTAADPVNGTRPRQVQSNVIKWTVDRLWCYDNVYWEIANEPEGVATTAQVSQWHADMVTQTVNADNARVGLSPGLTRRHRIAVNPSNTTIDYINMANVDVVNGHYTEIYSPRGNMGAMQLIRGSGIGAFNAGKLLGFNETKISALPLDNAVTLPPVLDSILGVNVGGPDSARAEGWEFMVNRGATYDHWGYRYASQVGQDVRTQMGHLRTFIAGLPLRNLQRTPADGSVTHPAWLPNLLNWDTYRSAKGARIYWAALEPTSTATTRVYVLYVHNSLRRCQSGTDSSTGCASGNLPLNGYNPVIGPAKYQETLTLSLTPGKSYTVEWIRPKDRASLQTFTLNYNMDNSCTGGFSTLPCQIKSPTYDYDVVLKLTELP